MRDHRGSAFLFAQERGLPLNTPKVVGRQETGVTFGSLFAGIGGLDLGFEREGFECLFQVEIDDYAMAILKKHWPQVLKQRDIVKCNGADLPTVNGIVGGFPCQDISFAGKGEGLDGERSGLFFEAIRLVVELQPEFVVLENVAALLSRGLDRVLGTLAEIGFDAEWHCIPAAYVGAPHIRDRVFVIAYSDTESPSENKQQTNTQRVSPQPRRIRDDLANTSGPRLEERKGPPKEWPYPTATRSNWWSTEPDLGRVANGVPKRVDRLRCLGNAVVPQVAEVFGRYIVEFNERA